jgi:hypothetical protein
MVVTGRSCVSLGGPDVEVELAGGRISGPGDWFGLPPAERWSAPATPAALAPVDRTRSPRWDGRVAGVVVGEGATFLALSQQGSGLDGGVVVRRAWDWRWWRRCGPLRPRRRRGRPVRAPHREGVHPLGPVAPPGPVHPARGADRARVHGPWRGTGGAGLPLRRLRRRRVGPGRRGSTGLGVRAVGARAHGRAGVAAPERVEAHALRARPTRRARAWTHVRGGHERER